MRFQSADLAVTASAVYEAAGTNAHGALRIRWPGKKPCAWSRYSMTHATDEENGSFNARAVSETEVPPGAAKETQAQ